jgi:two-component system, response regulator PdtaR
VGLFSLRRQPDVRILIAEDETIIRLDLRSLLEDQGFVVCAEARDGVAAAEIAEALDPDLTILDVKMPTGSRRRGASSLGARSRW